MNTRLDITYETGISSHFVLRRLLPSLAAASNYEFEITKNRFLLQLFFAYDLYLLMTTSLNISADLQKRFETSK